MDVFELVAYVIFFCLPGSVTFGMLEGKRSSILGMPLANAVVGCAELSGLLSDAAVLSSSFASALALEVSNSAFA